MMTDPKRFTYHPMRKPMLIQPQCPVYIYAYALAVQRDGGAAFAQVRLVNRSDRVVHSVFLRLEGKDPAGNSLYELKYVPLVDCMGQPHTTFGEEQPLFLPEGDVYSIDVQVLDVLFTDGMIWRKQAGHELMTAEQARWQTCSCGMKNPEEASHCAYCRKPLKPEAESCVTPLVPVPTQETLGEMLRQTDGESVPVAVEGFPAVAVEEPVAEQTYESLVIPVEEGATEQVDKSTLILPEEPVAEQIDEIPVVPMEAPVAEQTDTSLEETEEIPERELCDPCPEQRAEDRFADFAESLLTGEEGAEPASPEKTEGQVSPETEETPTAVGGETPSSGYLEEEDISLEALLGVLRAMPSREGEQSFPTAAESALPVKEATPAAEESAVPLKEAAPTEEESSLPTEEMPSKDLASETEASDLEESPNQWMRETERMLQEFRRRMEAREQGNEASPAPTDSEPEEGQTEASATESASTATRGVMFWVLMVIFLIVLGAAAFFGVLYFKGYFG